MIHRRPAQDGQMLLPVIAVGLMLLSVVAAIGVIGAGQVATVRAQRVADLASTSGVRLLVRMDGEARTRPEHAVEVLHRRLVALAVDGQHVRGVYLPDAVAGDAGSTVEVEVTVPGPFGRIARARSRAGVHVAATLNGPTGWARGGGYNGPLVYRDGRPTCPSVAAAFDLMSASARRDGVLLRINSGFRSDAEQAVLFARHPDPRWVAPPGKSRHRDATELDLGPASAYRWLSRNAGRFGFVMRYGWEPWHYGYLPGCGPPAVSGTLAAATGHQRTVLRHAEAGRTVPVAASRRMWGTPVGTTSTIGSAGGIGLPAWVPDRYRGLIAQAATSNGISPVLLAALLQAESGFNPRAVSPVGAQGIAQFMPATSRGMGLRDPFDPQQAIPAAGRLLGGHLRTFGSPALALAAYNAGPGAVRRYGGIPPYAETQRYVATILARVGGGGIVPSHGAWSVRVELRAVAPTASRGVASVIEEGWRSR